MKRILLSFACLIVTLSVFAQHPIGNDSFALQTLGNSNTLVKSKGAAGSDSGFVNAVYPDTTAANRGKIKNYPGAQIRVGNGIWLRNSTATAWIEITSGGGAFWPLAGTGTISATNSIESNVMNRVNLGGTATTTANNQYSWLINPNITLRNTTSDVATALKLAPSFTKGANNQTVISLDIDPTIVTGGFTGGSTTAIQVNGNIYPKAGGNWNVGTNVANFYFGNMASTHAYHDIIHFLNNGFLSFQNSGSTDLMRLIGGSGGTSLQLATHGNFNTTSNGYLLEVKGSAKTGSLTVSGSADPSAPTVNNVGVTGATTYSYKVVGRNTSGSTSAASSATSTTTGNATLTGSNYNVITWTEVAGYDFYDIYRTVGGATQGKIGSLTVGSFTTFTFNDVGLTGDGNAEPTVNTTGNLLLSTYGQGFHTGTPAYSLQVDASGNVIEGAAGGGGQNIMNANLTQDANHTQTVGPYLQIWNADDGSGDNTSNIVYNYSGFQTNANSATASSTFSINPSNITLQPDAAGWIVTGILQSGTPTQGALGLDNFGRIVKFTGGGISLTDLSATSPLFYDNTTGVFSIGDGTDVDFGGQSVITTGFIQGEHKSTGIGSFNFLDAAATEIFRIANNTGFRGVFNFNSITADHTVTFPDRDVSFTTVGTNFATLTDPSAITFPRINADNTVSALDAASFRAAIGAGTGGGTVTSVSGTANQIASTGGATPVLSLVSGGTLPGAWALGTPASVTLTNGIGLPTAGLVNNAVTYAKLQQGSAYTMLANNTGSTANFAELTYENKGVQTYAGTITWTGTTAPSGSTNHQYQWIQMGKKVEVWIWLSYSVAGTALTGVDLALPADLPLPAEPAGFATNNDVMYVGVGDLATSSGATANSPKGGYLVKTGTGTYKFNVSAASANFRFAHLYITYIAQ